MLDAALAYLGRGWSVVPGHTIGDDGLCSCRQLDCSPGKHPRVNWLEFQERRATERELTYWWRRWPDSNVIIITGAISGLVVVDVDPRHGGDEAWAAFTADEPMPETPVSLTGGGGRHLFFAHPGQPVPNGTNMLSPGTETDRATGKTRKLQSGVDFRGDGGYVLAPPSTHVSGGTYEWDASAHPDDVPLPPMPDALLRLVLHHLDPPEGGQRPPLDIEGLLFGNTLVEDGERNVELTRIAGSFARSVPDFDGLLNLVNQVNERACRPPLAAGEVKTIVRSIHRREQAQQQARAADEQEMKTLPPGIDPLAAATVLWQSLGVPRVTDWQILLGDRIEYALTTPESEIRIESLMDYDALRELLNNYLGVMPAALKRYGFDRRANLLRQCAREVMVEPVQAVDRVQEWVDAYTARFKPRSDVPDAEQAEALQQGPLIINGCLVLRVPRLGQFIEATFGEQMRPAGLRRLLRLARWDPVIHLHAYKKEIRT